LGDLSLRIIQPTEFVREYVDETEFSLPVLRAANVGDGELNLDDLVFVDKEKLKSAKDSFVEKGDILITRTGAKAGETCVVRDLPRQYVISSHSIRVLPNKNAVVPEYLENALLSKFGKEQVNRLFTGAAQKQLQLKSVATIQIPLPDLETQRALVADMESARAARQSKLAEAESLLSGIDSFVLEELGLKLPKEEKQSTFAVRLAKLKQGRQDALYYAPYYEKLVSALNKCKHPKVALGDISPELVGGATPTRGDAELYAESGIKFLRILNVAPNEIILNDVNYIQDGVHNGELKRSQLASNDVLMTITGRVGTAAVVPEEVLPANINQHIVRMRIHRSDCLPDYLAAYLNTSIGTALSNRGVTGGTRIALDYEVIRKIQIPIPPLAIQKKIVTELQRRRAQARQLREEAEREWQSAKEKFEKALLGDGGG
jgi:restriction endonuclease S subunit